MGSGQLAAGRFFFKLFGCQIFALQCCPRLTASHTRESKLQSCSSPAIAAGFVREGRGSLYRGMVILDRTPAAAQGAACSPLPKSPRFSWEVASPPSDPILPYLR